MPECYENRTAKSKRQNRRKKQNPLLRRYSLLSGVVSAIVKLITRKTENKDLRRHLKPETISEFRDQNKMSSKKDVWMEKI